MPLVSLLENISGCSSQPFDAEKSPEAQSQIPPAKTECGDPFSYDAFFFTGTPADSMTSQGVDPTISYAFSDLSDTITPQLAATLDLFLDNVGDDCKAHALLFSDTPPNGSAALTILGNHNGQAYEPNVLIGGGVSAEETESYTALIASGYTPDQLSGIFFAETQMPESWARAGRSTVQIYIYDPESKEWSFDDVTGAGSGVVIADDGTLLTARHVLYGDDSQIRRTAVTFAGNTYPIDEDDVLFEYAAADLAAVRLNELIGIDGIEPAALAKNISQPGVEVMAVGYPKMIDDEAALQRIQNQGNTLRLYSPGSYLNPTITSMTEAHTYLAISNRIYNGDSGGGLFTAQGELIGILSMTAVGVQSFATCALPECASSPELADELRALQEKTPAP